MFFKKKKLAKLAIACAAVTMPFTAYTAALPAKADASVLTAVIGAGISMAQTHQALKHLDKTEEGRQELFQYMKEHQGVNDDPYLNNRLDNIMANLHHAVAAVDPSINDKPYNYFINPDTSFNAACSLGHNMTVNTGIFSLLKTDDEIAVVLGHEMAHGQKNHVLKGYESTVPVQLLGTAVAAGGGVAGNVAANVAVNYIDKVHITKPNEWEADNLSFDYLIHSNYNLGATAAVWQKVMEQYDNNTNNFSGDLFSPSDHPTHTQRRDSYAKKLTEFSRGKVTVANGQVNVNGKFFVAPAASDSMSGAERSYFVAGNLARAYHNSSSLPEATVSNGTLYVGEQAVMTPIAGDVSAAELASQLNSIK